MVHYHGCPITPETAAAVVFAGGHAFPSFADTRNIGLIAAVCQSFAIDNGAFGAWKKGQPIQDWRPFYEWAAQCKLIPSCDFAVIPDVIDGSEADNDALLSEWPLPKWFGAPVWHMHESLDRLERLASSFPRVCIGSSGEFATVGTAAWWGQMARAMRVVCDDEGRPLCRLHGLRMLNPEVFTRLPLSSADSTNIGQNIGKDQNWGGRYTPPTKEARAAVMRSRIESHNSPARWLAIKRNNLAGSWLLFGNMQGQRYTKSGWGKLLGTLMATAELYAEALDLPFEHFSLQDCRPKGVTDKLERGDTDTQAATLHTDGKMIARVYDRSRSKKATPAG